MSTTSPNKSQNTSHNNSNAPEALIKFEKLTNKKLNALLRDELLLEVCKTNNLNLDQKERFETEDTNILAEVQKRLEHGEKQKENKIVIKRIHEKIQKRQIFSQKSLSSIYSSQHFQVLGLTMPRLDRHGSEISLMGGLSSVYSSPRVPHQSRKQIGTNKDFLKINEIQLNKMSVASKKNNQFQNQINDQMVVTPQYEVPHLNFGRVMREKNEIRRQQSKSTMIDAKKINLQINFKNISSDDRVQEGQRSHDFGPTQQSSDLLTNQIQLKKFQSIQFKPNKQQIQKEPQESQDKSSRKSLDLTSVNFLHANCPSILPQNMEGSNTRHKQIAYLKFSTQQKLRVQKKNEIKQSMKFIRVLGKNLREELKKKGQMYLEAKKKKEIKDQKLKKQKEKMQRKASHSLMLGGKMMSKIVNKRSKMKGNSSSNLYQTAQLSHQVNKQSSLKTQITRQIRQEIKASNFSPKRNYINDKKPISQSAGLNITQTNLKIGSDIKFTNAFINQDNEYNETSQQHDSQSFSSESLQSSIKDNKRFSQISLSQSSSGMSDCIASKKQPKKERDKTKTKQKKNMMPQINETMADMDESRNEKGDPRSLHASTEMRIDSAKIEISQYIVEQVKSMSKSQSRKNSQDENQSQHHMSSENPFKITSESHKKLLEMDKGQHSVSSKSNLVRKVELFHRTSIPQQRFSITDKNSQNQGNELNKFLNLQEASYQEEEPVEEEYYCEDSSQDPQSKYPGSKETKLSQYQNDQNKSFDSQVLAEPGSNKQSQQASQDQKSFKNEHHEQIFDADLSSVHKNTKESEIQSNGSQVQIFGDAHSYFQKANQMQDHEYQALKMSKFRLKNHEKLMIPNSENFGSILIKEGSLGSGVGSGKSNRNVIDPEAMLNLMAQSNLLSDQSSLIEDSTPQGADVLSGDSVEGFAMYNSLQEQQIQIYRIKNQSLSSISEECKEDGDQTYTQTHTSQMTRSQEIHCHYQFSKAEKLVKNQSQFAVFEYNQINDQIAEEQQKSTPLQRHMTSVITSQTQFEMAYANQLADQLSADGSSNNNTISSKNFIIKSQTSYHSPEKSPNHSYTSDKNSKQSSQISVNQMVPIVFKNFSPEYQQRKLEKANFQTANSPNRHISHNFMEKGMYQSYNTAQNSQNQTKSPTLSKHQQDAGCQGTPFTSSINSLQSELNIDGAEFDIIHRMQMVNQESQQSPHLKMVPSEEQIEELESDSNSQIPQSQSDSGTNLEAKQSSKDSQQYIESLVSDSDSVSSKQSDINSNTDMSESLSSDDNDNVYYDNYKSNNVYKQKHFQGLTMQKKKKHGKDIQICMSPMINRKDINVSDCELEEIEEYYLTVLEEQHNYDLIEKQEKDKQKIISEIRAQEQKLKVVQTKAKQHSNSLQNSQNKIMSASDSEEFEFEENLSYREIVKESEILKNLKIKLKRHETQKQIFAFNGDQSHKQLSDHNVFQRSGGMHEIIESTQPLKLKTNNQSINSQINNKDSLGLIQITRQPNSSINIFSANKIRNLGCDSTKELGSRSRGTSFKLMLRRNTSKDVKDINDAFLNIISTGKRSGQNEKEQAYISNDPDNKMVHIESSVTISSQSLTSPVGLEVSMQNQFHSSLPITNNITAQLTSFPNSSSGKTNKKSSSQNNQLTLADAQAQDEQDSFTKMPEKKKFQHTFKATQKSSLHEVKENSSNFKESSTTSQNLGLGESEIQPSFRDTFKELKLDEILIDSFSENLERQPYCPRIFKTAGLITNNQDDIKQLILKLNNSSEDVTPINRAYKTNIQQDSLMANQIEPQMSKQVQKMWTMSDDIQEIKIDNTTKSNEHIIGNQSPNSSSQQIQILDDLAINEQIVTNEVEEMLMPAQIQNYFQENQSPVVMQQTFKSNKSRQSSNQRRGHQMVHQRKQSVRNSRQHTAVQSPQQNSVNGPNPHGQIQYTLDFQNQRQVQDSIVYNHINRQDNLLLNQANEQNTNTNPITLLSESIDARNDNNYDQQAYLQSMQQPRSYYIEEMKSELDMNIQTSSPETVQKPNPILASFQTMIDTKQAVNPESSKKPWQLPHNQSQKVYGKKPPLQNQRQSQTKTPMKKQNLMLADSILSGSRSPSSHNMSTKNDAAQRLQNLQFMTDQQIYKNQLNSTQNNLNHTFLSSPNNLQKNKNKTMIFENNAFKFDNKNLLQRPSRNQLRQKYQNHANFTQSSVGHNYDAFTPFRKDHKQIDSSSMVDDKKVMFQHLQSDNSQRQISSYNTKSQYKKYEIFSPKNQKPKETKDVMRDIGHNLKSLMEDVDNIQICQSINTSEQVIPSSSNKTHRVNSKSPQHTPHMTMSKESDVRSNMVFPNFNSLNVRNSFQNISIIEHQESPTLSQYTQAKQLNIKMQKSRGITKNNTTQISSPLNLDQSLNQNYTQPSLSLHQLHSWDKIKKRQSDDLQTTKLSQEMSAQNRITFGLAKKSSNALSKQGMQNHQKPKHDRYQSLLLNASQPIAHNETFVVNETQKRSRNTHSRQYSTVQSPHTLVNQYNGQPIRRYKSRGIYSPTSNQNVFSPKSPSQISSIHQNLMQYQYSSDSDSRDNDKYQ